MTNTKTICIAGKNQVAIYGAKKIINNYPNAKLFYLHNKTDNGVDNWQPSFKKFATQTNLIKTSLEECQKIKNLIFISLEYDTIIQPNLFNSRSLFNVHFSKLPKYRGVYTSLFPLLYGETESGVTLHKIDEGIDTGDIIDQLTFSIQEIKSSRELYFTYMKKAEVIIDNNIDSLIEGNFVSHPQPKKMASYFSRSSIDLTSINVNFDKKAIDVINQIRAFSFKEYQLPVCFNYPICEAFNTKVISKHKAGSLINETDDAIIISTKDFNVKLVKDFTK